MAVLERLQIRDFRNIARAELAFPTDGVVVVGDNGQGKTNLLEAIYYFQLLRSLRGARDQDLIRFGAPAFHLHAEVTTHATGHAARHPTRHPTHSLSAAFSRGGRKKVVVDGSEAKRLTTALGSLPAVVLSPRDVELVIGAPSERRRYLDVALALTSPRYLASLQTYRAALARRNAALRTAMRAAVRPGQTEESVAVWEPALAASGAVLLAERVAWMARNASEYERLARAIGEPEPMTMRYVTSLSAPHDAEDELASALARRRAHDVRRGLTSSGPHRDDVALHISGRDVRTFGSAGQQRTAAITLRLLEAETLKIESGSDPVLLLDDPFAELDARRGAHILALLHEAGTGQTILAVPRATDIPADLSRLARWQMREGAVVESA